MENPKSNNFQQIKANEEKKRSGKLKAATLSNKNITSTNVGKKGVKLGVTGKNEVLHSSLLLGEQDNSNRASSLSPPEGNSRSGKKNRKYVFEETKRECKKEKEENDDNSLEIEPIKQEMYELLGKTPGKVTNESMPRLVRRNKTNKNQFHISYPISPLPNPLKNKSSLKERQISLENKAKKAEADTEYSITLRKNNSNSPKPKNPTKQQKIWRNKQNASLNEKEEYYNSSNNSGNRVPLNMLIQKTLLNKNENTNSKNGCDYIDSVEKRNNGMVGIGIGGKINTIQNLNSMSKIDSISKRISTMNALNTLNSIHALNPLHNPNPVNKYAKNKKNTVNKVNTVNTVNTVKSHFNQPTLLSQDKVKERTHKTHSPENTKPAQQNYNNNVNNNNSNTTVLYRYEDFLHSNTQIQQSSQQIQASQQSLLDSQNILNQYDLHNLNSSLISEDFLKSECIDFDKFQKHPKFNPLEQMRKVNDRFEKSDQNYRVGSNANLNGAKCRSLSKNKYKNYNNNQSQEEMNVNEYGSPFGSIRFNSKITNYRKGRYKLNKSSNESLKSKTDVIKKEIKLINQNAHLKEFHQDFFKRIALGDEVLNFFIISF